MALRRSALEQPFLTTDPYGRDDVFRHGLRPASSVVFDWEGFELFLDLATDTVRDLAHQLEPVSVLRLGQIELTLMRDGSSFGPHIDGDYPDAPLRKMAFVYYIGDRASFTGGELAIGGELVEPDDDSLVVFVGSDSVHEVLPVRGRDARRVTINGYFDIC